MTTSSRVLQRRCSSNMTLKIIQQRAGEVL
jgi:hypothetical protein